MAVEAADITDPASPGHAWSRPRSRTFGTIDIVVANAGGPPAAHALDVDDSMIDARPRRQPEVGCAADQGRRFPSCGPTGGDGSAASPPTRWCSPSRRWPSPTLARAGLWAWAKTAAQDLAAEESGITLNLLCPGPHATDRMRELGGAGVMGDPADFGRVAAFLCSRPGRLRQRRRPGGRRGGHPGPVGQGRHRPTVTGPAGRTVRRPVQPGPGRPAGPEATLHDERGHAHHQQDDHVQAGAARWRPRSRATGRRPPRRPWPRRRGWWSPR